MGKSALAKFLCAMFRKAGRQTLVYDITLSDEACEAINNNAEGAEWDADFATNDEDVFLAVFWGAMDVVAFVEEGGEAAGRYKEGVKFTATRGSHQIGELGAGSSIFFIAHSYTDLNKTLRGQLSEFYVFACSRESAIGLDDEFDEPLLRGATKLAVGEFYHVGAGVPCAKYKINMGTGEIEVIE